MSDTVVMLLEESSVPNDVQSGTFLGPVHRVVFSDCGDYTASCGHDYRGCTVSFDDSFPMAGNDHAHYVCSQDSCAPELNYCLFFNNFASI